MQFHTLVLTTLKGHEPLPGMVYMYGLSEIHVLFSLLHYALLLIHVAGDGNGQPIQKSADGAIPTIACI